MKVFEAKDAPAETVFMDEVYAAIYTGKDKTTDDGVTKLMMEKSMKSLLLLKDYATGAIKSENVKVNVRYITKQEGGGIIKVDDIPTQFARDVTTRYKKCEEIGSLNIFFGHGLGDPKQDYDSIKAVSDVFTKLELTDKQRGNTPPRLTFVSCWASYYNTALPRDRGETTWRIPGFLAQVEPKPTQTRFAVFYASKMLDYLKDQIKDAEKAKQSLIINLYFGEDSTRGADVKIGGKNESNVKVYGDKPVYRFFEWDFQEKR